MKNKTQTITLSNSASGRHANGNVTFIAQHDIPERFLFATFGDEAGHAKLATTHKIEDAQAIGIFTDSAKANEPINVEILNSNVGTLLVRAAQDLNPGDLITSNNEGKAIRLNELDKDQTYYAYGIVIKAAPANQLVEFTSILGTQITL